MRLSLLLAILPMALAVPAPGKRSEQAPLIHPRGAKIIPDKYIVKFKSGSGLHILNEALGKLTDDADHVYNHVFKGFASTLDESMLNSLRDHPDVDYIEKDSISHVSGITQQNSAPWGLGRMSNRQQGSTVYNYDDSAGQGTCAYVIDTGIDDTHPDFNGRAKQLVSFIDGQTSDGHGHGTHCAGTIGSTTYGVAKNTQLFGVKVLGNDGRGPNSAIISGMEYVSKDKGQRNCPKGVVANMSLTGDRSDALNQAAAALVQSGVFVGVAAGNYNSDASNYSPASEPSICCVGGTAIDDTRYSDSNWGAPVKILAPGVNIVSTRAGGGEATMTGTSMATPHIVGLAAYLGALEGLSGTDALCKRIQQLATPNAITDQPDGTVNLLAFNGATQVNRSMGIMKYRYTKA